MISPLESSLRVFAISFLAIRPLLPKVYVPFAGEQVFGTGQRYASEFQWEDDDLFDTERMDVRYW